VLADERQPQKSDSWLVIAISGSPFFLASDEGQAGAAFFASAPGASQQPIRDADDPGSLLPMPSFIGVFDGVVDDAPFLVELEHKQASELFVGSPRPRDYAPDLRDNVTDMAVLRLSASLPLDDQLFAPQMSWGGCAAILHHAL
jgi:hypothetical protein